jgi:hypothetical protein
MIRGMTHLGCRGRKDPNQVPKLALTVLRSGSNPECSTTVVKVQP